MSIPGYIVVGISCRCEDCGDVKGGSAPVEPHVSSWGLNEGYRLGPLRLPDGWVRIEPWETGDYTRQRLSTRCDACCAKLEAAK